MANYNDKSSANQSYLLLSLLYGKLLLDSVELKLPLVGPLRFVRQTVLKFQCLTLVGLQLLFDGS